MLKNIISCFLAVVLLLNMVAISVLAVPDLGEPFTMLRPLHK